jgi:acyl-CoA synthetase (AMP-forming)/AMP-acid ligase II
MKLAEAGKIADYRARGWWDADTIDDVFQRRVAENPQALSIVDPPNRTSLDGSAPQRLTWAELDALADRMATALIAAGVGEDGIVAVQMHNIAELVAAYFAVARIGAIIAPFPMQYREHELRQLCEFIEPSVFIVNGVSEPAVRAALRSTAPILPVAAIATAMANTDALAKRRAQGRRSADDIVTLCFTSGTTGKPKAVPRSHNEWFSIALGTIDGAALKPGARMLNPFPLVNMAGIGGMIVPWLMLGGVLINHHPLDLPVFLGQIQTEKPVYTVAPPALLSMLLMNDALLSKFDVSSLMAIGSGSSPLPPSMVRGWSNRGIPVTNLFGSNEGVCLISGIDDFPDPEKRAEFFPRFGAGEYVWKARVAQMQWTKLVDIETGETIEQPGRRGELLVKGAMVFSGYWKNPEANAAAFDREGFFRTGDLFEIAEDADGAPRYYRFVGRAKDLIIRGGMNIAPEEIEGLLGAHPMIAEVAVVGYPDPVMGEKVRAVVAPRGDAKPTLDDVVSFLDARKVAKFKFPERLDVVAALPRNAVGKILKYQLRAELKHEPSS